MTQEQVTQEEMDYTVESPSEDFMNWLDSVGGLNNPELTGTYKADRIEYLEDLQDRALYTIEVMFVDGVNCTDEVSDIRALENILEWAARQLEELEQLS